MRCCDDSDKRDAREVVREGYARIAMRGGTFDKLSAAVPSTSKGGGSCCADTSCCGPASRADETARKIGYGDEELATLPAGANMGLSCGNPTALVSLGPGEVVLDLGSGGGFDVFIAARKVGPSGRAIGVDMTPEMVSKARRNAREFRATTGLDNCEFRLGEIEHLPVADSSVDVVISNCVVNLSPEKPQVWREIRRVLKPGGRAAVSDIALKRPLPEAVRRSAEALVGCIAGAVLVGETERMAREAGLADVRLEEKPIYSDDPADWTDDTCASVIGLLPEGQKPSDYVVSVNVTAVRPADS